MNIQSLAVDLNALAPLLVLSGAAMVVLLLGLFIKKEHGNWLAVLSLVGLLAAGVAALPSWDHGRSAFGQMLAVDNFYVLVALLSVVVTGLAVLLSISYVERTGLAHPEYYGLLLFGAAGMLVMAAATNLVVLLIGIELLSLSLYVLAGFARTRLTSDEAALKYFLLGSFALGLLIYGTALIYGATGSLDYSGIAQAVQGRSELSPLLLVGFGLVLVGFAFKLSLVPFHMWAPDVYEGAPIPVTAFMAVGTKVVVFAALLRLLLVAFPKVLPEWAVIVAVLSLLTMVVGNLAAVVQTNIKRLLAYSSIAHAGYILMALVAGGTGGVNAMLFYLLVYAFMNFGAFGVMVAVSGGREEKLDLDDYAGLAKREPWLAATMAVFMLSLAGVPPTAGFMAKLYVFSAAIQAGYLWLAIVGVAASVVSVYYYLKVIVAMYMREPSGNVQPRESFAPVEAVVLVAFFFTLQLGIFPGVFLNLGQLVALGR